MTHYPKFFLIKVMYLKKQFKVQIIGLLEEKRLLLLTKNALMKRRQKIGQGLPPLVWTKSKRTAAFFRETVQKMILRFQFSDIIIFQVPIIFAKCMKVSSFKFSALNKMIRE